MPIGIDDTTGGSAAPAPVVGGAGVDAQKAKLNEMVQSMLSRATQPKMGLPAPVQRNSPESMQQQGFNMSPAYSKKQDIGIGLQNMGTLVHNLVAQHKQNQTRDALADWQSFDNAIEKAQMAAGPGDPSDPAYQKKVNDLLSQMPWVKAQLDPANPKAQKRLKNMYKALNVDLLDDKENVYGQALKQLHKVKGAEKQLRNNQQLREQFEQKRQQTMQSRMANLMQQVMPKPPSAANSLEAAKVGVEAAKAGMDKWEFKQGSVGTKDEGQWFAFDKTNPTAPALKLQTVDDATGQKQDIHTPPKGGIPKAQIGKPVMAGTMAIGMMTEHGMVSPNDPAWKELPEGYKKTWAYTQSALAQHQRDLNELMGVKGASYAREKAKYNLNPYVDGDHGGNLVVMSDFDASKKIHDGANLIATQSMPMQTVIGAQRMQREATPAIKEMRKYLSAFDDQNDRLIMAQVAKNVGDPGSDAPSWMANVASQMLSQSGKLSDNGRQLVIRQRRLAEALVAARSSMGALATDSGVQLALGLFPGPNMPDSKLASDTLDQLQEILENSLSTQALKGVTSGKISDGTTVNTDKW